MRIFALAAGAATLAVLSTPSLAQVGNPATPRVGQPASTVSGPPAPVIVAVPVVRSGPLPSSLTLDQALEEASARSPAIVAAEADLRAAEAAARQAGLRPNPELSIEVENFAGTGSLRGVQSLETTIALNQRLDLGGRRSARVQAAGARLLLAQIKLRIALADLGQSVREQFAKAIAASERLDQASESVVRARELARITGVLVDAGRDPPLRAIRARSALAQAIAAEEAARADEVAARSSLAALLGEQVPVTSVRGSLTDPALPTRNEGVVLEEQLAAAEQTAALAALREQQASARLDPAVGAGVRHVKETGDIGLVAGLSMPLPVFDRNRGNIDAARANLAAAEARRANVASANSARARNAAVNLEAAQRRVEALNGAAVPEASEALRLAELSYKEGRASLLELIDAQDAYTAARNSLIDARLALAIASAELARVNAR